MLSLTFSLTLCLYVGEFLYSYLTIIIIHVRHLSLADIQSGQNIFFIDTDFSIIFNGKEIRK